MEACLACGCSYLDTANYEPKDEAHFEYSWQWAYKKRFEEAGLTAILGCGFDPGVTSIFTAYAAKHHFDEIQYLDIVDCNAGNHHKAFATNFNPEINIREITQKGLYWEDGKWVETAPLEIHKPLNYPEIGPKESYLLHHEEIESLVKNYPTIKRARFWMTFGQQYLTYLDCIQNLGMSRIDEITYEAPLADDPTKKVNVKIVPLQFLKAVLPNPQDLGENYEGQTSIGCRIRGLKDGKEQTYYVYNNCSHEAAYKETGMQGVSYTTGVPAMIGAMMFFKGLWRKPGVWNVEEFDPDPFMEHLGMSRIDEITYEAPLADDPTKKVNVKIVPLQFLKAVLPNPQDLGENYEGQTSIGCRIRGLKDGKEQTYYVYNNCSHEAAYKETGMQGVSYTTGVPAMIGAMMFFKGLWRKPGVWNVEEFDPDPFMEQLNKQGLPWHEKFNVDIEL